MATNKRIRKSSELSKQTSTSIASLTDETVVKSTPAGLDLLVQARMEVGRVDDPAEVEADAMALDFLRWQQSSGKQAESTQRRVSPDRTSRSSSNGTMETGGFAVDGGLESEIARETGRGAGLDGSTRGQFEGFFGVDLGGVRLHADSKAAELSRSLGAEAFTVGNDVFFGEGKFAAGSSAGMGLLAHELTHVVQQGGSSMRRVDPGAVALSRSPLSKGSKAVSAASDGHNLEDTGRIGPNLTLEAKDPAGVDSAEGLAMAASTVAAASAIADVFEVFQTSNQATKREKIKTVFDGLKAAMDTSKAAVETARAASTVPANMAMTVIPGLGLAVSIISFASRIHNQLLPLMSASGSTRVVLDGLKVEKGKTTDAAALKKIELNEIAVHTLLSTEHRNIGFTVAALTGELVQIVGQVATLATGPFGMAVTLLGVALNLGTQAVKKITEWSISHSAAKKRLKETAAGVARDGAASAAASAALAADANPGDKALEDDKAAKASDLVSKTNAFDLAHRELLASDANSAFIQILEMTFSPIRQSSSAIVSVEQRKMLRDLGVTDAFINSTIDQLTTNPQAIIRHDAAVEQASALVAVGEPMTIGDRAKGWMKSVGSSMGRAKGWLAKKMGGDKPLPGADDATVNHEAAASTAVIANYVAKKDKQGKGGVKPDKVNVLLQAPYQKLVARIVVDPTTEDADLVRIGVGLTNALKSVLAGAMFGEGQIDISTVKVTAEKTKVTVTYGTKKAPLGSRNAPPKPGGPPNRPPPPTPGAKPAATPKAVETINPMHQAAASKKSV